MLDVIKLLATGVIQGTIDKLDLILLIIIIIISSVALYKNNKYFKIAYNVVVNILPRVKRRYVLVANFSKLKGTIDPIINKYAEAGCKTYVINKNKFNDIKKIDKEFLEEIIKRQQETIIKAKDRMKNDDSFIYIGFPHIPLGFLDGYIFTDSDTPILYENQHTDMDHRKKGFFELEKIYNTNMRLSTNINETNNLVKEVALKIEQSFTIDNDGIKEILGEIPIINLSVEGVGRSCISNYSQIDIYKKEFEKVLCELKTRGVEKIHLFATTPASLTFSSGSVIKHYHPEVIVYNFNNGIYDWAINLATKNVIIPDSIKNTLQQAV